MTGIAQPFQSGYAGYFRHFGIHFFDMELERFLARGATLLEKSGTLG